MNKQFKVLTAVLAVGSLLLLAGCAKYKAISLPSLAQAPVKNGISFAYKAFNSGESKMYLGRNLLEKGYQPVQITITNNTDRTYKITPASLSMPIVDPWFVAESAHSSTVGRSVGYGAAAVVLTCGILAIPAIVDGVKSHKANKKLGMDYSAKAFKLDSFLRPHNTLNGIVFVQSGSYNSDFTFTITDTKSNEIIELNSMSEYVDVK
jgi:hypothetical protein